MCCPHKLVLFTMGCGVFMQLCNALPLTLRDPPGSAASGPPRPPPRRRWWPQAPRRKEMIELKILVDDIDYNSLTELLVPLLAEKLEKDGKGGILGGVLSGNRNMAVSMARTLLNTMPQAKKDELVVQLINKNRDKLLQKGRALAAKNGVRLQLCDVAAKKI